MSAPILPSPKDLHLSSHFDYMSHKYHSNRDSPTYPYQNGSNASSTSSLPVPSPFHHTHQPPSNGFPKLSRLNLSGSGSGGMLNDHSLPSLGLRGPSGVGTGLGSSLYGDGEKDRLQTGISLPPLRTHLNRSPEPSNQLPDRSRLESSASILAAPTNRSASRSISSTHSPYSFNSAASSSSSLGNNSAPSSSAPIILPSPGGLGNLRPSFSAYSPPSRNRNSPPTHFASTAQDVNPIQRQNSATNSVSSRNYDLAPLDSPQHELVSPRSKGNRSRASSNLSGNAPIVPDILGAVAFPTNGQDRSITASTKRLLTKKRRSSAGLATRRSSIDSVGEETGANGLAMTPASAPANGSNQIAQNGQGDPSAVRRLAHLQCEQRRRESINGGFATLRHILPETTAADSKAAILQKAIAYIQNLEQSVRASGGKLEAAVSSVSASTLSHIPGTAARGARRAKKSSMDEATEEVEPNSPPLSLANGLTITDGAYAASLPASTATSSVTSLLTSEQGGVIGGELIIPKVEDDVDMDRRGEGHIHGEDIDMAELEEEARLGSRVVEKRSLSALDLLVGAATRRLEQEDVLEKKSVTPSRGFWVPGFGNKNKSSAVAAEPKAEKNGSWAHFELGRQAAA